MRSLIAAFQFLTILPIPSSGEDLDGREIGQSSAYFPVVGALQGGIVAGSALLLSHLFSWEVVSALSLIIVVLTNGGFHLDGFADTVDGLAGGTTREERLTIMKDPRTGSIGVVALILLLLLQFILIKELHPSIRYGALFLLPVVSRWSMVPMAFWGRYAREGSGLGRAFTDHTGPIQLTVASAFTALALGILLGIAAIALLVPLTIIAWLWVSFFRRRLGGVTGDVFGFQSELSGVLFLLLVIGGVNSGLLAVRW
ncbi:MAG: adenosylcobinamide-GDP ribazoletransferase [Thermodesulfobacteriota bacterium]